HSGLVSLAKLRRLGTLLLSKCPGVGDRGMEHIAKLSRLRSLDLSSTRVTDGGLEQLRPLQQLRSLYLIGLDGISDRGLEHVTFLSRLRRLLLGNCRHITD